MVRSQSLATAQALASVATWVTGALLPHGPGGGTPHHEHEWEHQVFVLEGSGEVLSGDTPHVFRPGDVILVPGGEKHQFRNPGEKPVCFLCMVPARKRSGQ